MSLRELLLSILLLVLVGPAQVSASDLLPDVPKARKGTECVEPVDVMRRNHMDFIMHQRDDTVHDGIRTKKYSFTGCIDCHATQKENGEFMTAKDEGHFCSSCHEYAAVSIDCFQCHASKPEDAFRQTLNNTINNGSKLTLEAIHKTNVEVGQ